MRGHLDLYSVKQERNGTTTSEIRFLLFCKVRTKICRKVQQIKIEVPFLRGADGHLAAEGGGRRHRPGAEEERLHRSSDPGGGDRDPVAISGGEALADQVANPLVFLSDPQHLVVDHPLRRRRRIR